MANLVALLTHCRPSDELFVDREAHVLWYESGGFASVAGVVPTMVPSHRGHILAEALEAAIRPANVHYPRARLVWLENTHNRGGGSVMPLADQRTVEAVARRHGLAVHLDGARVFNAAAAQEVEAAQLARGVDSLIVDLTKGLSCPLGALLLGSREFIAEARFHKRVLGGGMRQAGVIAACGIVALEDLVDRLAEDHARARALAERLASVPGLAVDPATVETNMVYVDVGALGASSDVVAALRADGLLVSDRPPDRIRLVTHLQISDEMVDEAIRRIVHAAERLSGPTR
jgi:threonine aldolase